jgi:hypothetical protein
LLPLRFQLITFTSWHAPLLGTDPDRGGGDRRARERAELWG